ncbi:Histone-lysine N-methyltransferase 2D [Bienertia sinuspersici]
MWFCGCKSVASPESKNEESREQEIENERERERELERETTQNSPKTDIIEHFTHPHPLIYIETDYGTFRCNACNRNGRGKRYHCAQCNFDLHKVCAQSPIIWLLHQMPPKEIERFGILHNIIDTFAHPQHSVIADYKKKLFRCVHCKNVGDGLRYYCDACDIMLHQVCAEHPTRLTSHLHPQHELELKVRPHLKHCEQCGTKGNHKNNRMYVCKDCDFYMHPECSQLPLYLLHPLHPPHPLQLKGSCTEFRCSACLEWRAYKFKYSCTRCGLDFDQSCIIKQSIMGLNDEVRQKYTEHKITVLPIANLISSYAPTQDPPTSSNYINPLTVPINIIQIISEI